MAKVVEITVKINAKDGAKNIGDLNKETKIALTTIRELEDASAKLTEELKDIPRGTQAFEDLSKQLIKVNTELKNQDLALEALDHEQVASEIKSVAGGLVDMASGLILVGASSESLEVLVQTFAQLEGISKIVAGSIEAYSSAMKLSNTISLAYAAAQARVAAATEATALTSGQAAIAEGVKNAATKVSVAFSSVYEAVQKRLAASTILNTIASKAQAVATRAQAAASGVAAVGMRILNAVMNMNPVFLLITGVTALVGAFYLFGDASEDVAAQVDKLNATLELQLDKINKIQKFDALSLNLSKSINKAKEDDAINLYETEIALLELKTERTAAEDAKLVELRNSLTIERKNAANQEYQDLQQALLNEQNAVRESLDKTIKAREEIVKRSKKLTGDEYNDAIDKANELGDKATELSLRQKAINNELFVAQEDTKNKISAIDRQATVDAAREAEKRKQNAINKAKETRNALLAQINDILARQKSASDESEKLRIASIENLEQKEIELQELQFGTEKDQLIQDATKREISLLEKKFLDLKISEKEFMAQRKEIVANGVKNFIAEEQKLYADLEENNTKALEIIKQRYADEANLTKTETEKINADREKYELDLQKRLELIKAESIPDEEDRQKEILAIKQKYAQKEIDAINKNLDKEKAARKAQYDIDINQKGLTTEKKEKIDAQYQSDVVKLEGDAQEEIANIQSESVDKLVETLQTKVEKMGEWVNAIGGLVSQASSVLQTYFDQQNEMEASQRDDRFKQAESELESAFANRLITETEYNNKVKALQAKKDQEELQQKRKAFRQNKALAIVNAVLSTAQAVISAFSAGASLGPAGIVAGPVFAAVAGALGAVQIGLIASQKFTAARGGVVPGMGSGSFDSVDARLAPGETVINSNSSRMFPNLLSEINQVGGGISLAPTPISTMSNNNNNVYQGNNGGQMIEAYVVESKRKKVADRMGRMERAAEVGR